jgi:hypothetical protein
MQDEAQSVQHPTVQDYLTYVQDRRVVTFKQLAEPKVRLYDCPNIACIFLQCLHEDHKALAVCPLEGQPGRCDEGSSLPCSQEEGIRLELLGSADYMEIVSALATKLQLSSPDRLRLTQHNAWAGGPSKQHVKWKEDTSLDRVLRSATGTPLVVYYEVRANVGTHIAT